MFQRTLLRQLTSAARPAPRASLIQKPFQNSRISLAASSRPIASARCYSSEPDAKKDGEEKAEKSEKVEEVEDPVKKELEAKKAEVIDLKVRCHFHRQAYSYCRALPY